MERRQVQLKYTKELLAKLMGLREDVSIVDVKHDAWTGTVTFLYESERFEPVLEGHHIQSKYLEDIHKE